MRLASLPRMRLLTAAGILMFSAGTALAGYLVELDTGNRMTVGACDDSAESQQSREEIEAEQRRIEQHMLRVQQERFEARARGDAPKTLRRLDREFERTQQRRIDTIRKLGDPPSS